MHIGASQSWIVEASRVHGPKHDVAISTSLHTFRVVVTPRVAVKEQASGPRHLKTDDGKSAEACKTAANSPSGSCVAVVRNALDMGRQQYLTSISEHLPETRRKDSFTFAHPRASAPTTRKAFRLTCSACYCPTAGLKGPGAAPDLWTAPRSDARHPSIGFFTSLVNFLLDDSSFGA